MRIPHTGITLAQLQGILTAIATTLGIAAAVGLFGWFTVPKAVLYARYRFALGRATTAESALSAISAGFEALERRVAQLSAEVMASREETKAARAETAVVRAEILQQRTANAEAALWTVDVIRHFRKPRASIADMPQPPASIPAAVLAEIHANDTEPLTADIVRTASSLLDR